MKGMLVNRTLIYFIILGEYVVEIPKAPPKKGSFHRVEKNLCYDISFFYSNTVWNVGRRNIHSGPLKNCQY